MAPARSNATFYINISNPESKTRLIGRLHLGKGIYAGDEVATNRDGKAYIKIINTNVKIVVPRVEQEKLDKIVISGPEFDFSDYNDISNHSIYTIAVNHIPIIQARAPAKVVTSIILTKKKKITLTKSLISINIYSDYRTNH